MSQAAKQRLAGKCVLITGASSGIGWSTALEFAATSPDDLKLVLAARRVDRLQELSSKIGKEIGPGVTIHIAELDVSQPSQVNQFVTSIPEPFREIDILVNNAGLAIGVDQAPNIKEDDIRQMFETNVFGLINMTQAILPIFKRRAHGGQGDIIMLNSIAGREAYQSGSIYCASKSAVKSFTDALRKELISSRIRVIEVAPGQVETEFSVVRFRGDQGKADSVYTGVEPLTPVDIAELIVFAASRRENVVVADSLIFPNHQVSCLVYLAV
ncbi:oxidoreductase [Thozetella sp. PMI_491]|nr:oxidoreductase [Thozetella sp. PMI_491]